MRLRLRFRFDRRGGWLGGSIIILVASAAFITPVRIEAADSGAALTPSLAEAAPTPADVVGYRLGPQDSISISVPLGEELKGPFTIDQSGDINIPFVGIVNAGGFTIAELEASLDKRLAPFFVSPHAVINIVRYGSKSVSVFGAVRQPSVHYLKGYRSLVEVLSDFGGLAPDAGPTLTITRSVKEGSLPLPGAHLDASGKYRTARVNLALLLAGNPEENIPLCADDVIIVQPARLIYVLGDVKQPGGFPLHDNSSASVIHALALAQGTGPSANSEHARLIRGRRGHRTEIRVDIPKILKQKNEDPQMNAGDVLYIPSSKVKVISLRALDAAINVGTGVVIWR